MGWFKSQMWKVLEWKDDSKDTMVYRFPMDGKEIMSGSQLTVRESQVAIFVHQGKIADIFTAGQHKLTSRNLPILSGIGAIFYQGDSRFKAELYFINTKQFLDLKWGTTSPVTMRDKEFGAIRIKAYGNYGFRVVDPEAFLKEVFGTNGLYKVDDIDGQLKSMLISVMSDTIAESKISALDMSMNYTEFGGMILDSARANAKIREMGLAITNFTIVNINFPETVEKALDDRASLGILSDKMGTYTQKKAADALGDAAKSGGMANAFVGMGAGQAMNSVFGNLANAKDSDKPSDNGGGRHCPECGAKIGATTKFCPECGTKQDAGKVCPKCCVAVKSTTKFCPECGEKL
jgi:membrane protease subunit (stomatin/prohibitin family)